MKILIPAVLLLSAFLTGCMGEESGTSRYVWWRINDGIRDQVDYAYGKTDNNPVGIYCGNLLGKKDGKYWVAYVLDLNDAKNTQAKWFDSQIDAMMWVESVCKERP